MAILSVYYKNNRMKVSLLGIHLASIELRNSSEDFSSDNIIIDEKLEYICTLLKNKFRITDVPQACGNRELVQKASLSILSKFSGIMEKNGIKWWLDSGTLIGYVRHKGFVPWDDDIDIAMMRDDYNRLPDLLNGDFVKEGFFYRVGEITRLYFGNLRIWVDVFPMDLGDSETPYIGRKYEHFVKKLNNIKSTIDFDGKKWMDREVPVTGKYLAYCKNARDSELVGTPKPNGFIFYGVETCVKDRTLFPHSVIFPLKKVSFLGIDSYVPNNCDYYLYSMYGDYLNWPNCFDQAHDSSFLKTMTSEQREECKMLISKYCPIEMGIKYEDR